MMSVCSGAKVVQIRLERRAVEEVSLEVRCPAEWDDKTIESHVWDNLERLLRHIGDSDWDYMDDTIELVEVGAVVDGECVQLDLT
jgi:hypothetical protein